VDFSDLFIVAVTVVVVVLAAVVGNDSVGECGLVVVLLLASAFPRSIVV
jgi:hypothetical protein